MKDTKITKQKYHHGDLQATLLAATSAFIEQHGKDDLSLRKLAESVGVSRTAVYHHFKNKNDLLCAVAAEGFKLWLKTLEEIYRDPALSPQEQFKAFFYQYVKFAKDNASIYDLMFGHTIWKDAEGTKALKDVAYPTFQHQVEMTQEWQDKGLLPQGENSLRLAQVLWGSMHGIARLFIDGIYTNTDNIEEMVACAINVFLVKN